MEDQESHSIKFVNSDAAYVIVANKFAIVYRKLNNECFVKDVDTDKIIVSFNEPPISVPELLDWIARIAKEQ
jgi:DNA topoisomerase VI subunit A